MAIRFQCDSMTPLGVPVLPLEKMTAAMSSGFTRAARRDAGRKRAANIARSLRAGVNCGLQVFEENQAGQLGQLGLLHERARSQNGFDAAGLDGVTHRAFARREVEIHRGFA